MGDYSVPMQKGTSADPSALHSSSSLSDGSDLDLQSSNLDHDQTSHNIGGEDELVENSNESGQAKSEGDTVTEGSENINNGDGLENGIGDEREGTGGEIGAEGEGNNAEEEEEESIDYGGSTKSTEEYIDDLHLNFDSGKDLDSEYPSLTQEENDRAGNEISSSANSPPGSPSLGKVSKTFTSDLLNPKAENRAPSSPFELMFGKSLQDAYQDTFGSLFGSLNRAPAAAKPGALLGNSEAQNPPYYTENADRGQTSGGGYTENFGDEEFGGRSGMGGRRLGGMFGNSVYGGSNRGQQNLFDENVNGIVNKRPSLRLFGQK